MSLAVLLSLGQVTVTVTGTAPGCCGAVHCVCCPVAFANVPVGAVQRYVTAQLIESCTVADTVELAPTSTVHGLHAARTLSLWTAGGGGGGGAGGGGGGGGGGGT